MKLFNTIETLWQDCLFCPICQKSCRTIDIQVGPDFRFVIDQETKINSTLKLYCRYSSIGETDPNFKLGEQFNKEFVINVDCLQNSFEIESNAAPEWIANIKTTGLYLYTFATCNICDSSYSNSADLECRDDSISNIQIEHEGFHISSDRERFHIVFHHDRNVMEVSRSGEAAPLLVSHKEGIELPLVDLDFSDPAKTVAKLRTYILLS